MGKIFISGSINIKFLNPKVISLLDDYISKKDKIIVGDAVGVDQLIQKYANSKGYYNVVVCTILKIPRVLESKKFEINTVTCNLSTKSERERQTEKDIFMTRESDISFIIRDGKSTGSYNNIIRGIQHNKNTIVFVHDEFLPENKINVENIRFFFDEGHEYSLTEYLEKFKESKKLNVNSTKQMKSILIENGVLNGENSYNMNYEKDISIKNIRGREIIKFKKKLLDMHFLNSSHKEEITQNSLF